MKKITEELNRYNSINQYISEQENKTKFDFKVDGQVKNISPDENWKTTYSCVTKQPDVVSTKFGNNTTYTVKNITYFNNGTKQIDGKLYKYDCNTEFKTTNDVKQPINNAVKPGQKVNPALQQTISINNQIQQKMGIKQTGKLTHVDLEKLIGLLRPATTASTSGEITPAGTVTPIQTVPIASTLPQQKQ